MTLQGHYFSLRVVGRRVLPLLLAAGGVCGLLWVTSGQWLWHADAKPLNASAERWEPAAVDADAELERQATPPDTVEFDGLVSSPQGG